MAREMTGVNHMRGWRKLAIGKMEYRWRVGRSNFVIRTSDNKAHVAEISKLFTEDELVRFRDLSFEMLEFDLDPRLPVTPQKIRAYIEKHDL